MTTIPIWRNLSGFGCLVLILFVGCSKMPPASPSNPKQESKGNPHSSFSHLLINDAEYYTSGPQQGRPPDGTFQSGANVNLIQNAGSYSLVRSEDGIEAYVASDSLKRVDGENDMPNSSDVAEITKGNNEFALTLYGRLASSESGNLFFSPASISTAFAMTYAGAKGETEQQMSETLHLDLPQDRLHPAFDSLNTALVSGDDYQLRVANRLWGQEGYGFLPDFLRVTREHYDAELAQVDFVGHTEAARQHINAWVEEKTEQKIKDLIPQNALDSMTRLVLTNAIYFKGNWTNQFDESLTRDAPFHTTTDEKTDVPMMRQKENFNYAETDELQILAMPYGKNEDLSMLIFLPKEIGGLSGLERQLTTDNLDKWSSGLREQEVQVFLPRFQMTSEFQLNDTLQSMGMTLAFSPSDADFSGMNGKSDLFISAAIHKAFVDVNEEGTEAAAATGIALSVTSFRPAPVFRADHPFVFLIQDNRTGGILFVGRVVDPVE